jgi:hypothetical protein
LERSIGICSCAGWPELVRTNEESGRCSVENVGAGEDDKSSGTRDVVDAEDGGISKRCWNKSDLLSAHLLPEEREALT